MVRSHEAAERELSILDFRKGSAEAFKLLFFEYYPEFYSFCMKFLQHRSVAQKVTMDVFFLFWNKRADFEDEKRIRAFLYLAIRNRCIRQMRDYPDHQPIEEATRIDVVPGSLAAEILRDIFSFAARCH